MLFYETIKHNYSHNNGEEIKRVEAIIKAEIEHYKSCGYSVKVSMSTMCSVVIAERCVIID